ncbi:lanthionine synthetase-like protein [Luteibacter sp. OK325]|uniref:lanthionine synthetase C family protein n=1 Tax=Luteibacter sp. OK325 TaxID=2135670 RepID=UPI000D39511D|nr:lanthionine synthetase C family protein [Luteibacter sp. OK325]PTR34066.1 lanthionine synthetase-like protein [Luteibacter sp. OK325]
MGRDSLERIVKRLSLPLAWGAAPRSTPSANENSSTDELIAAHQSSLANGRAGLALTCGVLHKAHPDSGWDRTAHKYLEASLEVASSRIGLFDGLCGLGFVADYLSCGQRRYQRFLASIELSLKSELDRVCIHVERSVEGCCFSLVDIISGLSGIAIFLTRRANAGGSLEMLEQVGALLTKFVVTSPGKPLWRQPEALLQEERSISDLNLGLAHGLPGILVALSKVKAAGVQIDRIDDALEIGVGFLERLSTRDKFGLDWASWGASSNLEVASTSTSSRTAWCYGAPGVCAALWHVGKVASRRDWQDLAREGMAAVEARTLSNGWDESPTFCHGTAGVLHIARRFSLETGDCLRLTDFLLRRLIDDYQPFSKFGYRDFGVNGARVDRQGVLQGTAGILLVILGFVNPRLESDWDDMFALS